MKKRRIELGLSADQLAEQLGKNRSTVFRYENGEIENLPLDMLEPISKALCWTPQQLMGWDFDEKEEETQKNSDAMSDITARMFNDSDFFGVVDFLQGLNNKDFSRVKVMLHNLFEESFDIHKD